jgi:hypothetical protein
MECFGCRTSNSDRSEQKFEINTMVVFQPNWWRQSSLMNIDFHRRHLIHDEQLPSRVPPGTNTYKTHSMSVSAIWGNLEYRAIGLMHRSWSSDSIPERGIQRSDAHMPFWLRTIMHQITHVRSSPEMWLQKGSKPFTLNRFTSICWFHQAKQEFEFNLACVPIRSHLCPFHWQQSTSNCHQMIG